MFKFDPDPNLTPKTFFSFFQISHFGQLYSQISSEALCVELTEFLKNIYKMLILKPKLNLFSNFKS